MKIALKHLISNICTQIHRLKMLATQLTVILGLRKWETDLILELYEFCNEWNFFVVIVIIVLVRTAVIGVRVRCFFIFSLFKYKFARFPKRSKSSNSKFKQSNLPVPHFMMASLEVSVDKWNIELFVTIVTKCYSHPIMKFPIPKHETHVGIEQGQLRGV